MILRALGWQGVAGLVIASALALLLLLQKGETRHWRRQSNQFEQLHRAGEAALAGTIANYRAAAIQAREADRAAAARVAAQQTSINQRTAHDYQTRLAAARARADQLRRDAHSPATDPGARRGAPVPGLAAAPGEPAQAPGENRLPELDQRARRARGALGPEDALIATEQAIQLDELIKWVRRQHQVAPNAPPP